jgi:hypothetical protein
VVAAGAEVVAAAVDMAEGEEARGAATVVVAAFMPVAT